MSVAGKRGANRVCTPDAVVLVGNRVVRYRRLHNGGVVADQCDASWVANDANAAIDERPVAADRIATDDGARKDIAFVGAVNEDTSTEVVCDCVVDDTVVDRFCARDKACANVDAKRRARHCVADHLRIEETASRVEGADDDGAAIQIAGESVV